MPLGPGGRGRLAIDKPEVFLVFLQTCFRHKRKTLRNNLGGAWPSKQVEATLAQASLTSRSRAEELTLEQFTKLVHLLPASWNKRSKIARHLH